jgi:hypothetical protein
MPIPCVSWQTKWNRLRKSCAKIALMQSTSPVWTEEEVPVEKVIALDQEQYQPIIILPVTFNDGIQGMCVRFRLSEEERKAIAEGADVVITELTFGGQFTPLQIMVCRPETCPY